MFMTTYTEQELPGISLTTGDTDFPVIAMDIKGDVDGNGVIWSIDATFENPLDAPAEAVFTIPLPVQGAVTGMKMKIGDREIAADIREREAARTEYEEAKEQGHSAALVEQERAEIFTITVGNIHPGEEISVVIEVHDRIAIDERQATLRFPTMIKERFVPAGVPDASAITPPRRMGRSPLRATVTISFSEAAKDLICETVSSAQIAPMQVSIRDFGLTGDIIIHWTLPIAFANAKWVADADDQAMGTLEVDIRVDKEENAVRRRKAIQIMVDRSGSMSSHYIRWAQRITEDIIALLTDKDLIHILTFDSSIDVFEATSHGFVPATRTIKQQLQRELSTITARGGTQLIDAITTSGAALETLLDRDDYESLDRVAVLITDGAHGDEASAVHHREKDLGGARVIAVAIGENANGFLEVLAANGVCVYVSSEAGLAEASAKVSSRVATAAHSKARLECAGLTDQAPSHAPDIYPGVIVTLSGRMPRPAPGTQVTVTAANGHVITLPISVSGDDSVTTRWASQHIKSLDYEMMMSTFVGDVIAARERLEALIVALSVKYRVLSKYTAWLAIDRSRSTDQVIVKKLVQPSYDDNPAWDGLRLFSASFDVDHSPSFPLLSSMMSSHFKSPRTLAKRHDTEFKSIDDTLVIMLEELKTQGIASSATWATLSHLIKVWLKDADPASFGQRTFNKIKKRMHNLLKAENAAPDKQITAITHLLGMISVARKSKKISQAPTWNGWEV